MPASGLFTLLCTPLFTPLNPRFSLHTSSASQAMPRATSNTRPKRRATRTMSPTVAASGATSSTARRSVRHVTRTTRSFLIGSASSFGRSAFLIWQRLPHMAGTTKTNARTFPKPPQMRVPRPEPVLSACASPSPSSPLRFSPSLTTLQTPPITCHLSHMAGRRTTARGWTRREATAMRAARSPCLYNAAPREILGDGLPTQSSRTDEYSATLPV